MTDQTRLDSVLDQIAQLADIGPEKKRAFRDAAFFVLCFAEWSQSGQRDYSPRDRKAMRVIAKAALALDGALKERTQRVQHALLAEWLTVQNARDAKALTADDFPKYLAWPHLLANLAGRAHWRATNHRRRGKRGAPTGFRNKLAQELADGLRGAAAQCGGKLTIDKTMGTGSLLTALELCTPLFPGFHAPSAMTLDRMVKKTSARRKNAGQKAQKSATKKFNF